MTKMEAMNEARKMGAGFIANVIATQHSNPARKLKGLVELLKSGHDVRTAELSIDILIVDGQQFGWEILESPVLVDRWRGKTSMQTASGTKLYWSDRLGYVSIPE